ncbi:hypothetical protein V6N13_056165 [Hibiscus sabdariffa]
MSYVHIRGSNGGAQPSKCPNTTGQWRRRNHVGFTIITVTASVSNISRSSIMFFTRHRTLFLGPYGLHSLSGSFIGSSTLAGAQRQLFRGLVGGKAMAATHGLYMGCRAALAAAEVVVA